MTNTSKLAMLLDELREAGATSAEIAQLVLLAVITQEAKPNERLRERDRFVAVLLGQSVSEGWLDKTPWRDM